MANKLAPYVNNKLTHVVPDNAHNLEKTLKSETIRRWFQELNKTDIAPPKSRNSAMMSGHLTATQLWTHYIAGKDVEGVKPTLGEAAAMFIVDHVILTTRDTSDPEETEEGD